MRQLDRPIWLVVRAASRFFLDGGGVVCPRDHLKVRRARSPNVTLEATTLRADDDGMASASMGLGPPVEDGPVAIRAEMPMVQRVFR